MKTPQNENNFKLFTNYQHQNKSASGYMAIQQVGYLFLNRYVLGLLNVPSPCSANIMYDDKTMKIAIKLFNEKKEGHEYAKVYINTATNGKCSYKINIMPVLRHLGINHIPKGTRVAREISGDLLILDINTLTQ